MVLANKVIFKQLTASDFYYINQPGLAAGGGQSYIDFDTSDISANEWSDFFAGAAVPGMATGGPLWTFSVNNLGSNTKQNNVKVGQRRATSYSIRSQKLPSHSSQGRRLHAWTPSYTGFPELPTNVSSAEQVPSGLISGLVIFLIKDDKNEIWAGWTRDLSNAVGDANFTSLFRNRAGLLNLDNRYTIDLGKPTWPFVPAQQFPNDKAADEISTHVEDTWLLEDELDLPSEDIKYSIQQVRQRDRNSMRIVRKLYKACQITGDEFVFKTAAGEPYLEVHHLIPLGKGGADSPHNMVVVSAHIHRMLHFAKVSTIDLSRIQDDQLDIEINGTIYKIKWHPKHAAVVLRYNSSSK